MKLLAAIHHPLFVFLVTIPTMVLLTTGSFAATVPPDITPEQACPVCGMYPSRYFKWQSQVLFQDGKSVAFEGNKDMFKFLLNPSKYPQHQGVENILAIWVRDFQSGSWIDGQQAHFVVGSDELGPMGKEIIPFDQLKDAEDHITKQGGKLLRFQDIDEEVLIELDSADQPQTAHHHHGVMEPIGVMGGHLMGEGDYMVSYRYMHMDMDGNRDGTSSVTTNEVLKNYMVAPLDMKMDMHMLGAMYAPTGQLTLIIMAPYLDFKMNHVTRSRKHFSTESRGLGDIKASGVYSLYASAIHNVHLNMGLSLPTGDIDKKDNTPAGPNQQLPYPMQLGSGTWDLLPGITYTGQSGLWSWGSQALATIHLGENSNEYTLGDKLEAGGWVGRQFGQSFGMSLRLNGQTWGNIDGADPSLNPMMVPTADPDLRGGTRLDLLAGLDFMISSGSAVSNRLTMEAGIPIYQNLDGPQLETDWILTAGWQIIW